MKTEKEDLTGQMNLFEMLSGDTDKKEQIRHSKAAKTEEIKEEEPETSDFYPIRRKAGEMHVVMHKMFEDMLEKEKIVVAYIDYNVIYYKEKDKKPQLMQYKSAKQAVDRYMEIVERLREDRMLMEDEGELILCDV